MFPAPNSQQLAFLGVGGLMKVDVGGGAPQTVCAALVGTGTWNRDGLILFQWRDLPNRVLFSVSSAGGTPVPATTLEPSRHEVAHSWPHFLPDGRHFRIVVESADQTSSGLYVGALN